MDPYALLGVPRTAAASDIARAYRVAALRCHPDRNPDGAEAFKRLADAYGVLSDPERRGLFDATGATGEDDAARFGAGGAGASRASHDEIHARLATFYAAYAGSAEERSDAAAAFATAGGCFERIMLELVNFRNDGDEEIDRWHGLLAGMVADGTLRPTKAWRESTAPKPLARLKRRLASERAKAERQLAKDGFVAPEAPSKAPESNATNDATGPAAEGKKRQSGERGGNGDETALARLFAARAFDGRGQWEAMTAALEERYGGAKAERRQARREAAAAAEAAESAAAVAIEEPARRKRRKEK